MGSIKLKLPNRSKREAAFMKKGKQAVSKGKERAAKPVPSSSTKSAVSLIGPRSKSAERSNERNAKSVKAKVKTSVEEFEEEEATPAQLSQISEQARKAVALDRQIEDLAAAQATLVIERDKILNVTLPAMFDSAGMSAFDLEDGSSVEIKDVVSGNLPSASTKPKEREKAIAWLMKNGGKGIIKTSFATEFGVDQSALVKKFESLITKGGFAAKKVTGVHHQTLCAFVRELLENGKKVPIETLGIYVGRHAKINLSEKQNAKADAERVKPKRRRASE